MMDQNNLDENYQFKIIINEKELNYSLLSYSITVLKNIDLAEYLI